MPKPGADERMSCLIGACTLASTMVWDVGALLTHGDTVLNCIFTGLKAWDADEKVVLYVYVFSTGTDWFLPPSDPTSNRTEAEPSPGVKSIRHFPEITNWIVNVFPFTKFLTSAGIDMESSVPLG